MRSNWAAPFVRLGVVTVLTMLPATALVVAAPAAGVRSVYLNGVDISSARSQDLRNVDIHINENGDIFIDAPHYQVSEEDTYVPLSKYVQGMNTPVHRPPQKISAAEAQVLGAGEAAKAAAAAGSPALLPKAGEPVSPPAASQTVQAEQAGQMGKADATATKPPAGGGASNGK